MHHQSISWAGLGAKEDCFVAMNDVYKCHPGVPCQVMPCTIPDITSKVFNLRSRSKSQLSDTSENSLGKGVGLAQEKDHTTHVILALQCDKAFVHKTIFLQQMSCNPSRPQGGRIPYG